MSATPASIFKTNFKIYYVKCNCFIALIYSRANAVFQFDILKLIAIFNKIVIE